MSEIFAYMQASIRSYVGGAIDVDAFRAEFAGAYCSARNRGPAEEQANLLASRLIGPIAEFSGGHRSEVSLRQELAAAIGPVAPPRNPKLLRMS